MSKATILVIEDEPWVADAHRATLRTAGYNVAIAPHAPAAMVMVDDIQPDAIVTDMLLPGSTAFALLHELQSYEDTGSIPVIVCTNLAENVTETDLKVYGVRRVIDKTTMHPADLVAAVRSVLP